MSADRAAALDELRALRDGDSAYQRWWADPVRVGAAGAAPWGPADQVRLDRAAAADPGGWSAAARGLAAEVTEVESLLTRVTLAGRAAAATTGPRVADALDTRCAELVTAARAHTDRLRGVVAEVDHAASALEGWWSGLCSALRDAGHPATATAHRAAEPVPPGPGRPVDPVDAAGDPAPGSRWPVQHGPAPAGPATHHAVSPAADSWAIRHAALITTVRDALSSLDDSGSLTTGWCGDHGHGAGWPCPSDDRAGPGGAHGGGHGGPPGGWGSAGYGDQPSGWHGGWSGDWAPPEVRIDPVPPEPGHGPVVPGVDATREDHHVGVDAPLLPDATTPADRGPRRSSSPT